MLERIREGSQGITAKIILGLVILTFALAGVGSYLSSPREVIVAVVNGEEITQATYDQALQRERSRMQQQFGEMYDMLASDPGYMAGFRNDVLERVIDDTLQKQFARQLGLRVGDELVRTTVTSLPDFQIDGVFSNERFNALLRQAGYQPAEFREMIREDLSTSQLMQGLVGSEFGLASEINMLLALQQQTRDVRYFTINADRFAETVDITDDKLQAYYQDNIQQFMTPEQVAAEYVELSAASLADDIEITEQQIADYYETNKARFGSAERREVAHIMLESAAENADVAQQAASLLAELQNGADFSELAKAHSADTFSAENGGILGELRPGEMDPAFEAAAFALAEQGQLSGVVRSEFGYHIIKLTTFEPATTKLLAEVKDEVSQVLRAEQATTLFYDLQQRLAQVAFEQPDNLDEAAAVLGTTVQSTELFARNNAPGVLAQPAILNRLFDARFISEGLNSDVLELSREHVVVVRIKQHEPARTQPLVEVQPQISEIVRQQEQSAQAQAYAQTLLAEHRALDAMATAAASEITAHVAVARFGGELAAEVRTKAFAMAKPVADQITLDWVSLNNGDVVIVALDKVTEGKVDTTPDTTQLEAIARQQAEQHYQALLANLKTQAKITRQLRAVETNEDI